MEKAEDFVNELMGTPALKGTVGDVEEISIEWQDMIESRDAAIRKECADRAVAWYVQGVPEPCREEYADEVASLRAAIMGEE